LEKSTPVSKLAQSPTVPPEGFGSTSAINSGGASENMENAYSSFISDYVYLLPLYNPCPDFDSFVTSKWRGFGGNKPK